MPVLVVAVLAAFAVVLMVSMLRLVLVFIVRMAVAVRRLCRPALCVAVLVMT